MAKCHACSNETDRLEDYKGHPVCLGCKSQMEKTDAIMERYFGRDNECRECGKPVPSGDFSFCPSCGKPLRQTE